VAASYLDFVVGIVAIGAEILYLKFASEAAGKPLAGRQA
jgi:hypothetical protein